MLNLQRFKTNIKGYKRFVRLPAYIDRLGNSSVNLVNDIQVATQTISGEASTVSVWVKAGAANDDGSQLGAANLLRSVLTSSIDKEVAQVGAVVRSGTCREFTVYNVQCLGDQVPKVLSVIGNSFQSNSELNDKVINSERDKILDQQEYLIDHPNKEVVLDYLHSAAYQETPYAHAPIGTSEGVKNSSSINSLQQFRNENYTDRNIIISVASEMSNSAVEKSVKENFGLIPKYSYTLARKFQRRPDFVGSQVSVRDDTKHHIQMAFGYETFDVSSNQYLPLLILESLIGSWSQQDFSGKYSSHQLAEIFSFQQAADSYTTFNYSYKNSGIFGIYVNSHNEEVLSDTIYYVFNQYQRIFAKINPHDIFRAKHMVISDYIRSLSTSSGLAYDAAKQIAQFGRRISPAEFVSRVSEVKEQDVYELLDTYFWDVDPAVVLYGPIEEAVDYGVIRGWTHWNRW